MGIRKLLTFSIMYCFLFLWVSPVCGGGTLKLLVWEGYAPPRQVKQFCDIVKKKLGRSVKVQVSYKVSDPKEFYNALRGGGCPYCVPGA